MSQAHSGFCVENRLKGSKGNILSRGVGDLDQDGGSRRGEMLSALF